MCIKRRPALRPVFASHARSGALTCVMCGGACNMTPADHSGFDEHGHVLITVRNGAWQLLED
jgi:branched-chain amino acid transport system substrate-binding protein